jgi:serine/threonine-protein kinase
MTPEYASPEQALGHPVTTASDVYQLGVLLYELLAGRRPYEIAGRSAREIERSICESLPAAPSTRAPVSLRKRLKGDLDAIVLRALRKEPEQRYPSAEALAEDVERHVAHLPLLNPGRNRWYSASKFLRRHRTPLAVAAGFTLLLIGLGASYTLDVRAERDRARQGEAKASESAALFRRFFQGWSPDAANRGEVSTTKMLDDAARRAERELNGDPQTLASTLSLLGELQSSLGEARIADSLLGRALAIQERLPARSAADLAATLARRGRLYYNAGRFRDAEAPLRRSLATYLSILRPERTEVILVQSDLAASLWPQNKLAEAEAVLRDAISKSASEDAPIMSELGSQLGYVLFQQGRYGEATGILRPVLERQRRIFGPLHLSTMLSLRGLAAALRDQGQLNEAEALAREALRACETLYGKSHPETVAALLALAVVLEREAKFAEAETDARQSATLAEQAYGGGFPTALHLRTLAAIRLARGDAVEAEHLLRRALAGFRKAFPEGHPDEGDVLNRLTYLALVRRAGDADSLYAQAARFEASRPAAGPRFVTDGYEYLAEAARLKADPVLAERMFRRAIELYQRQLPEQHPYRRLADSGLSLVLQQSPR